jgi:hypothetical protein
MKKQFVFFIIPLFFLLQCDRKTDEEPDFDSNSNQSINDNLSMTGTYEENWIRVESVLREQLTNSAKVIVEQILRQAKSENNAEQMIKAIIYRMKIASYKDEDVTVNTIRDLEKQIADSKFPVTSLLHSMLAEYYWLYYYHNRWAIRKRTQVIDKKHEDISTMDRTTIEEKIIQECKTSLQDKEMLQCTKLKVFKEVIVSSEKSER